MKENNVIMNLNLTQNFLTRLTVGLAFFNPENKRTRFLKIKVDELNSKNMKSTTTLKFI